MSYAIQLFQPLDKSLTKFFQSAKKAKKPTDNDHKANEWLPEAMDFPAIDTDCKDVSMEEGDFDDAALEEDAISDEEEDAA